MREVAIFCGWLEMCLHKNKRTKEVIIAAFLTMDEQVMPSNQTTYGIEIEAYIIFPLLIDDFLQ
jgi:hypothetical protein